MHPAKDGKGIGDCSFQAKTVQATRSNQYFKDPDWKKFPFSFLVEMNRFLPYSETSDKRQSFLIEDLLENFDSGSLCGTALLLEREAHQSIFEFRKNGRDDGNSGSTSTHTTTKVHYY